MGEIPIEEETTIFDTKFSDVVQMLIVAFHLLSRSFSCLSTITFWHF